MKRSTGVTVWAVLLILGGGFSLFGSVVSSALSGAMRGGAMEEQFRTLDAQLSQAKGADGQVLPPEQVTKLRDQLQQMRAKMEQFFTSPLMQVLTGAHGLVGLAALVAGIGLLLLKGWARSLAIGQAIGATVVGLCSQLVMHGWQQDVLQSMVSSAGTEPAQQQAMQQMMGTAQTFGLGLGIVLLLAWNGVLIWFLNRPSVKAQFQVS
jgi:hypothetical protein